MFFKEKKPKLTQMDEDSLHMTFFAISIVSPLFAILIFMPFLGEKEAFEVSKFFWVTPFITGALSLYSLSKGLISLNKMERVLLKQIKIATKNNKFLVKNINDNEKFVVFECPNGMIGISSTKGQSTKILLTNKDNSVVDISCHLTNIENFEQKLKPVFKNVKNKQLENEKIKEKEDLISEDSIESLNNFLENSRSKYG